jgi:NCAIR mutase (PurE)-related protein
MDEFFIKTLLEDLGSGKISVADAFSKLKHLPYEDIGIAKLDHHRSLRNGQAEVIFSIGKTKEDLSIIFSHMKKTNSLIIATKVSATQADYVLKNHSDITHYNRAGLLVVDTRNKTADIAVDAGKKPIAVVCGGNADINIAEEAAISLELFGNKVERVFDVGVAGIHRLFDNLDTLRACRAVIALAGMEAALPSVIAGLVAVPIVAVPTSIGYGVSEGGVAALLSMLASCSLGVSVVNIDNGFGAAYIANML